jgi:hypothetical protein
LVLESLVQKTKLHLTWLTLVCLPILQTIQET